MAQFSTFPENGKLPKEVVKLAEQVESDGGKPLAAYQEPIGEHWQLFALLPMAKVKPTPYQRDLSPTHMKKLREVMQKVDRFLDPIIAVRTDEGYWTPNGNHRRAAASRMGLKLMPAVLLPEVEIAYKILALNTEKAPNLKDKSLEVVRMYRALMVEQPRKSEADFAFEFERPHFATMGLIYERKARFSGGAYAPVVSRVDKFLDKTLKAAFKVREEWAEELEKIDEMVNELVAKGRKRGLVHPYLKNFIVSRCNPLLRVRKNLPSYDAAVGSLRKAVEEFDLSKLHYGTIASAATMAAAAGAE